MMLKKTRITSHREHKNRALGRLFLVTYNNKGEIDSSVASSLQECKKVPLGRLEDDFDAFMVSPAVFDYFFLLDNLTSLLRLFYERTIKQCNEIHEELNTLASLSLAGNRKAALGAIANQLGKIERLMGKQLASFDTQNDHFRSLISQEWHKQVKAYLEEKKNVKLDRLSIFEDVFGFNLTGQTERHERYWTSVILESLGQRDFYHQQIVKRLEGTALELARLYAPIRNVVSFKALVILTIWSYAHNDRPFSEICLGEKCMLAYGHFEEDYRRFKTLSQQKQAEIHLAYIDFEVSRYAEPVLLDMKLERETRSFGDLFRLDSLELSAMIPSKRLSTQEQALLQVISQTEDKTNLLTPSIFDDNEEEEEEDEEVDANYVLQY